MPYATLFNMLTTKRRWVRLRKRLVVKHFVALSLQEKHFVALSLQAKHFVALSLKEKHFIALSLQEKLILESPRFQ